MILFILFSGKQTLDFHRTKNLLKKNPKLLDEINNLEDIKKFINKNLAALGSDQKKKLLDKEIDNAEKDFSEENKNRLISAIKAALNVRSASETAFIFFIILLIIIFYIYWPVF